jgi:DnaK suppressor protein
MLTDVEIKQYQNMILQEIESTKESIKSLTDSVKPISPDSSLGRLTRMEAIQAKSITEANIRNKKLRLQKLEAALKRIEKGTYGLCTACEEEISEKRLKIAPESSVCMDCLNDT